MKFNNEDQPCPYCCQGTFKYLSLTDENNGDLTCTHCSCPMPQFSEVTATIDHYGERCPVCVDGKLLLTTPPQNFGLLYCDACEFGTKRHTKITTTKEDNDNQGNNRTHPTGL